MKFLALIIALLIPFSAMAQQQQQSKEEYRGPMRDSYDYTLDDGIMDQDEMEAEASDMYRYCMMNTYQQTYINCECLAGAFLIRRENDGPLTPQSLIYEDILRGRSGNCANTTAIAGDAYQMCLNHMNNYRELATDSEGYCTCVANRVANDFTRRPILQGGYISQINYNAMIFCNDPLNRPHRNSLNVNQ